MSAITAKSANDTNDTHAPAGRCQKCHNPLGYGTWHLAGKSTAKLVSGIIAPRLPNLDEIQTELEKLATHPGSVVIISIQRLETQNYHDVQFAWFNHDDRNAIKRAVDRARSKRREMASKPSDTPSNTNPQTAGSKGRRSSHDHPHRKST